MSWFSASSLDDSSCGEAEVLGAVHLVVGHDWHSSEWWENVSADFNPWTFIGVNSLLLFFFSRKYILVLEYIPGKKMKQKRPLNWSLQVVGTCPALWRLNVLTTDRINELWFYWVDHLNHRNSSDLEIDAKCLSTNYLYIWCQPLVRMRGGIISVAMNIVANFKCVTSEGGPWSFAEWSRRSLVKKFMINLC